MSQIQLDRRTQSDTIGKSHRLCMIERRVGCDYEFDVMYWFYYCQVCTTTPPCTAVRTNCVTRTSPLSAHMWVHTSFRPTFPLSPIAPLSLSPYPFPVPSSIPLPSSRTILPRPLQTSIICRSNPIQSNPPVYGLMIWLFDVLQVNSAGPWFVTAYCGVVIMVLGLVSRILISSTISGGVSFPGGIWNPVVPSLQAVVDSIAWAFRRLKKPKSREMSARGYSVCPQLPFSHSFCI